MKKINVAELLKDCPKGMELDCTVYNNITLEYVCKSNSLPICVRIQDRGTMFLSKYGQFHDEPYCKCVIFPKGKTTWEGFHRPFKEGDIVFYNNTIAIFKEWGDSTLFRTHCTLYTKVSDPAYQVEIGRPLYGKGVRKEIRFATKEEKQKLFDAIKAHDYRWNAKTKTLEKLPRFKVGDRIKYRGGEVVYRIVQITEDSYVLDNLCSIPISIEHMYNLVPNKFDITTLKPFNKVLVRQNVSGKWSIDFFGGYAEGFYYTTGSSMYVQCIPYKGNEHLLSTTDDCDEFYKTWK